MKTLAGLVINGGALLLVGTVTGYAVLWWLGAIVLIAAVGILIEEVIG